MYYDVDNAEAITVTGQLVIQYIEKEVNKYFNDILKTENIPYVVASDTDSIYIVMDRLVQAIVPENELEDTDRIVSILDKIVQKKINEFLNEKFVAFGEYMNCNEQVLMMKRENIAKTALWVGAKNYIMDVFDVEGVRLKEPDLKITGIAAVKSSTPEICRDAIKEAFIKIIREGKKEMQDYIKEFRAKFNELPVEVISAPRGVNDVVRYRLTDKGVPIHVTASLVYNKLLKDLKLEHKYEKIKNGDKIKFVYLKLPNKTMYHVIGFPDSVGVLPPEFGLHHYVDRETQFNKVFLSPIEGVTNVIGWDIEEGNSLEGLFF